MSRISRPMSWPLMNSAEPTTRMSTPSPPTNSAVSRLIPPSTWTSPPWALWRRSSRAASSLSRATSFMNDWPPNPGSTVMTSTMSSSSAYGSSADSGVAGLTASPAARPASRMRAQRRLDRLLDLDVERDRVAAGVEVLVDVAARLADHQVGVERQLGPRPEVP